MWVPLVIDDLNYLIKCYKTTTVKVYLTDFKAIWLEEVLLQDLQERFKELNPLFDAGSVSSDDLLHKIVSLINNIDSQTTTALTKENNDVTLDLKCRVPEFSIRCKFYLSKGDEDMYFTEFTVPLMQSVQYLEIRQKKLFDMLEKKDKEIQEHQLEGGEISRKSLVTKRFDRNAMLENIPEQLFINVFGKSKVFYDTFANRFGSVVNVNPKIKVESTESNARKKIKIEKPRL